MATSSTPSELTDLTRFRRFRRHLAAMSLLFAGIYVAAAAATHNIELAIIALLLIAYWVATRVAGHLADAGKIALATGIIAYGVLGIVLSCAFLIPFAYPSLTVAALLSVAMALPYLGGRALRVLLGSSLLVIVVIGARGFTDPGDVTLPRWIRLIAEEGGAWAAAYLLLLLLWQFTERLRYTLDQTRTAHQVAEASRQRAAFLSEASQVIGASSLDYRATLSAVARVAVPTLGDYCVIDELDSEGRLRRVELVHADPRQQDLLERLRALQLTNPDHPSTQVMSTLEPAIMADIDDARLRQIAQSEEHLATLRELGPCSAVVLPLVARGRALGSMLLARTTKERPYSNEDLELAKDLARRAALATDNARLYKEAQAAIRTRDEFLSIASHELRTPLTPLELQIQSLRKHTAEIVGGALPSEWFEKRLDMIARQSERLGRLVNELLDISRIANDRFVLELERVDLAELLHEVEERFYTMRESAKSTSRLEVHVPEGIVGYWDRMRLDQVITNLLSNALKYGSGNPIEIAGWAEEDIAKISVTDQGIGIAAEDQERIFERFERAVPSANFGGLGLGLFVARQILGAMGGRISVRSSVGQGATFLIQLPLEATLHDVSAPARPGFGPMS